MNLFIGSTQKDLQLSFSDVVQIHGFFHFFQRQMDRHLDRRTMVGIEELSPEFKKCQIWELLMVQPAIVTHVC